MQKWIPEWNWDIEIVLEDCNFLWKRKDLCELKQMWEMNYSIEYMSDYLDRDPDEVMLGLMHLAKQNRIGNRRSGLKGER